MTGSPPVSQERYVTRVVGSGTDYVAAAAAPGETIRHWVHGDAHPRVVIDIPNHQVLVGDGTVTPIPLSTGGGADLSVGIRRDTLANRGAFGNPGYLFGATDNGIGYFDDGSAWLPYFAGLDGSGKIAAGVVPASVTAGLAPIASPTFTGTVTLPATGAGALEAATKAYVDTVTAALVNSAPATLDTLKELSDALGADPNFATTVATSIGTKLAKASNLSDLANAATARTNLGLLSAATHASTDFALVANNLSDLLSAATARTNLGVAIGSNVQAWDADLDTIAALAPPDDDVLQRKGGAWVGRTMPQLAVDLGIPPSLAVLLGSIDAPPRCFDRFRGAPNGVDTSLAADITSTATTITTRNVNLVRVGEYPVVQIGTEQMQVIRGQGTTTLIVRRHVNGTTAAAHVTGDFIIRDKVRNTIGLGDSTAEGSVTSVTGEWDAWQFRVRRILNERFGGSLGQGFVPLYRKPQAYVNPVREWDLAGSWFGAAAATAPYFCGPWDNYFGTSSSAIATYTRPVRTNIGQIDVWYIVWPSANADSGTAWSYSTDGGATWIDNPQANVDTMPNTTTLGSADNGRRCDYWDGTKSMTVASTATMDNAGFVLVDVGSASTFKARALFTYDSVTSGTVLGNVQYVGPTQYNALTTVTGDTVQVRPELRKASVIVTDPTTFKVRCSTAAGTSKTCMFAGINIWSSPPTFGVTRGIMHHNLGYNGNTAATFVGARTISDAGTTNGSPTLTALRGAFTSADVGSQVFNANVPAGTIITAVGSGTSVTMNNNATATVTAGSAANATTIQGMRGGWDRAFNGCPASLLPDLIITSCWTNDFSWNWAITGGDVSMSATFTIGSPNVVVTAGNAVEQSDVGANVYATVGITPALTTMQSSADATHFVMSANALANATGQALIIGAQPATPATAIKNILSVLTSGGIGGTGFSAYADQMLVVPFEQGGGRLNGSQATAASQVLYRQAMHDWATANNIATLDIYKAWAAEGCVGNAAALAIGLMDTTDASALHEGPLGYRDMATRITRFLEFA